jgi:hypothetical protein
VVAGARGSVLGGQVERERGGTRRQGRREPVQKLGTARDQDKLDAGLARKPPRGCRADPARCAGDQRDRARVHGGDAMPRIAGERA